MLGGPLLLRATGEGGGMGLGETPLSARSSGPGLLRHRLRVREGGREGAFTLDTRFHLRFVLSNKFYPSSEVMPALRMPELTENDL